MEMFQNQVKVEFGSWILFVKYKFEGTSRCFHYWRPNVECS